MDKLTDSAASPDGAWTSSDHHVLVPDTSMLPEAGDKGGAAAIDLMKRTVRGAHAAIDGFAVGAAPAVRQLGETVSGAKDALQAKASDFQAMGGTWAAGARATVRGRPLAWVLGALALGVLVGRARR
jgi:hypothetical protein